MSTNKKNLILTSCFPWFSSQGSRDRSLSPPHMPSETDHLNDTAVVQNDGRPETSSARTTMDKDIGSNSSGQPDSDSIDNSINKSTNNVSSSPLILEKGILDENVPKSKNPGMFSKKTRLLSRSESELILSKRDNGGHIRRAKGDRSLSTTLEASEQLGTNTKAAFEKRSLGIELEQKWNDLPENQLKDHADTCTRTSLENSAAVPESVTNEKYPVKPDITSADAFRESESDIQTEPGPKEENTHVNDIHNSIPDVDSTKAIQGNSMSIGSISKTDRAKKKWRNKLSFSRKKSKKIKGKDLTRTGRNIRLQDLDASTSHKLTQEEINKRIQDWIEILEDSDETTKAVSREITLENVPEDQVVKATFAENVPEDQVVEATFAENVPEDQVVETTFAENVPEDQVVETTLAENVPEDRVVEAPFTENGRSVIVVDKGKNCDNQMIDKSGNLTKETDHSTDGDTKDKILQKQVKPELPMNKDKTVSKDKQIVKKPSSHFLLRKLSNSGRNRKSSHSVTKSENAASKELSTSKGSSFSQSSMKATNSQAKGYKKEDGLSKHLGRVLKERASNAFRNTRKDRKNKTTENVNAMEKHETVIPNGSGFKISYTHNPPQILHCNAASGLIERTVHICWTVLNCLQNPRGKCACPSKVSKGVKEAMDCEFSPGWQVIVGRKFSLYVTPLESTQMSFRIGRYAFYVFKTY